jgi:hypothetical protein
LYQEVQHHEDYTQRPALMILVVPIGGHRGACARTVHWWRSPVSLMNSGSKGRWDMKRTCNLRMWSLLPIDAWLADHAPPGYLPV